MKKNNGRTKNNIIVAGVLLGILVVLIAAFFYQGNQAKGQDIDFNDRTSLPAVSTVQSNSAALRVAISSVLSPQATIAYYRVIADYLGEKLGRPVILIQRENYSEIGMLLVNGGADIAFFSAGEYAAYSGFDQIKLLVGQVRHGAPHYQGYLLVAKDSPIHDLEGLRGKSVAFTDPLSYSGYTFVASQLKQQHETPATFFGRYIYTYSHDKSLRAVASRVVDAAPVTSFAYDTAKITAPDLVSAVKIIAVSPPAGIGPVVVSQNVSPEERRKLRQLFLDMNEDPQMTEALAGLMVDRFIPPDPTLYNTNRQMLQLSRER